MQHCFRKVIKSCAIDMYVFICAQKGCLHPTTCVREHSSS